MNNIILIGMPGAGKSTIGVLLAKSMLRDFVDTDLIIQKETGKSLSALIKERGIEGFLQLENDIICQHDFENCVIATGGSAVYGEEAMAKLRKSGLVVYIKADIRDLEKRLSNIRSRGIAMKKGTSIEDLFSERYQLYESYSDITVSSSYQTPEECVESIIASSRGQVLYFPDEEY